MSNSLGSKIVGRVAFVYRGEYNPMVESYTKYDIVLVPNKGLYHCVSVTPWQTEGKTWDELDSSIICDDPKGNISGDGLVWVLFLPITDVYQFMKDHLKSEGTIDIKFYDEESDDPVNPGEDGYHDIQLDVNPNALTWSGETTYAVGGIQVGEIIEDVPIPTLLTWMLADYVGPKLVVSPTNITCWIGKEQSNTITWTLTASKNYPGETKITTMKLEDGTISNPSFNENKVTKTYSFVPSAVDGKYSKTYKGSVQDIGTDRRGNAYPIASATCTATGYAPLVICQLTDETWTKNIEWSWNGTNNCYVLEKTNVVGEYANNFSIDGYLWILIPKEQNKTSADKLTYNTFALTCNDNYVGNEMELTIIGTDGNEYKHKYNVFRSKESLQKGTPTITIK